MNERGGVDAIETVATVVHANEWASMLSSVSVQSRALMHERVRDVDESVGVNERGGVKTVEATTELVDNIESVDPTELVDNIETGDRRRYERGRRG